MNHTARVAAALLLAAHVLLLGGCTAIRPDPPGLFDLGPLPARNDASLPALAPVSVASIGAPAWLDSTMMFYRLNYDNNQQPRPYSQARWTMPPSQLLLQQLKSRISRAGGVVLAASHGALNVPVLRIEVDDFTQLFDTPGESKGSVSLRASLFRGRTLVAHQSFARQIPASSASAAGGAEALATATDAALTDLIAWLAATNLK